MPENRHTMDELRILQALPLEVKIEKTRLRIREWINEYGEDGVYVSFSGGKDSTVLLDIVRKDYPNVKAVFINTGLEYPSVRKFAESKENVVTIRPKMNFREVVTKYGYPIISKEVSLKVYRIFKNKKSAYLRFFDGSEKGSIYDHTMYRFLLDAPFMISHICCDIMKKEPFARYGKKPIIATMAEESKLREQKWLENGCNAFDQKKPKSNPMSFWTEQDVLTYIHTTLPLQTFTVGLLLKAQRTGRLA